MRHARALAQAITDIISEYGYTKRDAFLRYYEFYSLQFITFDDLKLMKQVKLAINFWCAKRLRQEELPEKPEFKLFPRSDMVWIKHKTQLRARGGKTRRLQLIHSIAQCKNVLEVPTKSFYKQAYEKHAATLSLPPVRTPTEILSEAFKKGQEFGVRVNKVYNPYQGYVPGSSATFDLKRSDGGKKGILYKKNTVSNSTFRCEPTVLFLHGEPGVGKSRLVNEVVRSLCKREQIDFDSSCYIRNCNTAHWDGYKGQMITILDDWGQDVRKSEDILEVISLVTENSYPLSMADLRDKGTLFTSRYIILCSNTFSPTKHSDINITGGSQILRNIDALLRRLHFKFYLLNARTNDVEYVSDYERDEISGLRPIVSTTQKVKREVFTSQLVELIFQDSLKRQVGLLKSIPEYRFDYPWRQSIYNDDYEFFVNNKHCHLKGSRTLEFPIVPPQGVPKVRTCAVSKPLGARMVTCGSEELHVLKPLQVAMWRALGTYEKFQATHGKSLNDILPTLGCRRDDQFILSGDYESATDGMNMDLSNALLAGILSRIDHAPTRAWATYENGQHEVHYPPWTGINPIQQTTGQLMGSLLSFPLLCLANDLITDLAGIVDQKLINGDDLLAHCGQEEIKKWKEIGTICGMKPSVGKNYTSKIFGTFNSQLVVYGKHVPYTNLKLVSRKDQIGNCAKIAQNLKISKRLMVKRSKQLLIKSPQSIDVSVEKGGLGSETTKSDSSISMLDKLCYFSQLLKKDKYRFRNAGLPAGYKWQMYPTWDKSVTTISGSLAPNISAERLDLLVSDQMIDRPSKERKTTTSLSYSDIAKTRKKVLRNPLLRQMLYEIPFSKLPPLNEVGHIIHVTHKKCAIQTFNSRMKVFLEDSLEKSRDNNEIV